MATLLKFIFAGFLVMFAAVHGGYEMTPAPAGGPSFWQQRPGNSWLLNGLGLDSIFSNTVGQLLWVGAMAAFVAAGLGVLGWIVPVAWWRLLAIGAAAASLLLALLFWHPWQWASAIVDAAILAALLWPDSPVVELAR